MFKDPKIKKSFVSKTTFACVKLVIEMHGKSDEILHGEENIVPDICIVM